MPPFQQSAAVYIVIVRYKLCLLFGRDVFFKDKEGGGGVVF